MRENEQRFCAFVMSSFNIMYRITTVPMLHGDCRVARYNGDHKVKSFTCLEQLLVMIFAQLTFREILLHNGSLAATQNPPPVAT